MIPTVLDPRSITRGDNEEFLLTFNDDGVPFDLRTWAEIRMQIKSERSVIAESIAKFTTLDGSLPIVGTGHNQLQIPLTSDITQLFTRPGSYVYDIRFYDENNECNSYLTGILNVELNITD